MFRRDPDYDKKNEVSATVFLFSAILEEMRAYPLERRFFCSATRWFICRTSVRLPDTLCKKQPDENFCKSHIPLETMAMRIF